jgi:iron(III) transport system substrate-binding protein
MKRMIALSLALFATSLALSACGGSADDDELTIYSGRSEKLVGPLIKDFEEQSGIKTKVRYGDSAELAATIAEEGDSSPADVFFSQDAGALGAVEAEKLLAALPDEVLRKVDRRYRDSAGQWVGASGRSRVVAYSTERLRESEVPDSIFDFTDPKWKGKIGFAPPNASFQAFVSAMRLTVGDARTERWLEDIQRNDPVLLENNIQTEEAIAAGEIDVGFVNHYYVYELRAERPGFPVKNHFLRAGDPGSLVNVAGAGILKPSDQSDDANRFVEFLLSERGQRYFAEKTFEYPLVAGTAVPAGLPGLAQLQGPEITLDTLGTKLKSTLEMLNEAGLSS